MNSARRQSLVGKTTSSVASEKPPQLPSQCAQPGAEKGVQPFFHLHQKLEITIAA
jgi:hypothetical protein